MLQNYLLIALRSFWRNRLTGLLNILGLTIGISGCLLVGAFVWDEWRFDRFIPNGDRIYRVYNERFQESERENYAILSAAFAPAAEQEAPEIEASLRMMDTYGEQLFKLGEKSGLESKGIFVEPIFFSFFGLSLLEGDPATALAEPNKVVLTTALARKYFGKKSPLGQAITIGEQEMQVSGVIADAPAHFHLNYQYLLPFSAIQMPPGQLESWVRQQFITYLKLIPNTDVGALEAKLNALVRREAWPQTEAHNFRYVPHLQPLHQVHLYSSSFQWDLVRRGNYLHVWALSAIGLFLLGIAVVNFINLATARAERRAREVGVRKATGARREQLIYQFLSEALLLALVATFLGVQLSFLLLPSLNEFTGKQMELVSGNWLLFLVAMLGFALFTGLLAGLYPAFVLSGFRPVQVLKGQVIREGQQGGRLRKALVVAQFSLTVLLIISSLAIYRQLNFLMDGDMGFNREHVLFFNLAGNLPQRHEAVKERFSQAPGVVSVSAALGLPGDLIPGDGVRIPGQTTQLPASLFTVDYEYIPTLGMEIVAGRAFSRDFPSDMREGFIINEAAVREYGFGSAQAAVGRQLEWDVWGADTIKRGQVIGVVRDFNFESLRNKVGASVLHIHPDLFYRLILRIDGERVSESLAAIKKIWDEFQTGYPFQYKFIDDSFAAMYEAEDRLQTLMLIFTGLTIFVACLGLLGLAIFAAERRTREIGIRKVLGATVGGIVGLLAWDFLKLVGLAVLIAIPLAWYLLRNWLEEFAYRVELNPWMFAAAGGIAFFIALLTVGFHSARAALANPVRALRSE